MPLFALYLLLDFVVVVAVDGEPVGLHFVSAGKTL